MNIVIIQYNTICYNIIAHEETLATDAADCDSIATATGVGEI